MSAFLRRLGILAVLVGAAGCCGSSASDYFEGRPPDDGDVLRVWACPMPYGLSAVAVHCHLELRTAENPPGPGERWEVWQRKAAGGTSWGHVHRNLMAVDAGVGGGEPWLVAEVVGPEARSAVQWIRENAPRYADRDHYRMVPGPNSNTFVAVMLREAPGLSVDLPPHAVGKDWPGIARAGTSTTATGVQVDTFLLGLELGLEEGIEVHLLGLTAGIDLWPPALKTPFGRVGFPE